MACNAAITSAAPASGDYRFAPRHNPPLTVYYYRPEQTAADAPIVFALHGLRRQGAAVRDAWISAAQRDRFVVVVPQFDADSYRGSVNYNTGRVLIEGKRQPVEHWSFQVIEEVFDDLRARLALTAPTYSIFGHSAGGQFVHRFALLMPAPRAERYIAANAGWYTLPVETANYPWGLAGAAMTAADVCRAFSRPLLLLLGDRDTDPEHEQLNRSPQAQQQGPHRLARGQYFMQQAEARARELGCPLKWAVQTVPGVGHEFDKMGEAGARALHRP